MKTSKQGRNAHIKWTLAKYGKGPQREVDAAQEAMGKVETACMDCTDEAQWVAWIPMLNRMERRIEASLAPGSLVAQLDALKACLPE